MTDRQFSKKKEERVMNILKKYAYKQRKMIFDDSDNVYGPSVENPSYLSKLNVVYYVVLGKKVYMAVFTHEFTRWYDVKLFKNTILYKPKIKKYNDVTVNDELITSIGALISLFE